MNDEAKVPAKIEKAAMKTGAALQAFIPETMEEMFRMADALANQGGDMVPSCYRAKPGAIMLAMQKGAELGLAPLAAIQTIVAINGRATLWGDAIPGLIWKAGHRIEEWIKGEGDDMVAHCCVIRKDGTKIERTFSVEDAKLAKLWGKAGPWVQYPKRMLAMRARSWAARDGAADVLMGLSVREEVDDFTHRGPDRAKDVTPEAESLAARVARTKGEDDAAAPDTPEEADEPVGAVEDAETVEDLTPEQEADIMADIQRKNEEAEAAEDQGNRSSGAPEGLA